MFLLFGCNVVCRTYTVHFTVHIIKNRSKKSSNTKCSCQQERKKSQLHGHGHLITSDVLQIDSGAVACCTTAHCASKTGCSYNAQTLRI
jgi:hypothetical protein